MAEVLNAIYEADFYGFSYGFRPGRSPHRALESLEKAVMTQRVNWVLDFDIRTFFDSLDHDGLVVQDHKSYAGHREAQPEIRNVARLAAARLFVTAASSHIG